MVEIVETPRRGVSPRPGINGRRPAGASLRSPVLILYTSLFLHCSSLPAAQDSGAQKPEARIQHPEALFRERSGPDNPKRPVVVEPDERVVPVAGTAEQVFYITIIPP